MPKVWGGLNKEQHGPETFSRRGHSSWNLRAPRYQRSSSDKCWADRQAGWPGLCLHAGSKAPLPLGQEWLGDNSQRCSTLSPGQQSPWKGISI